MKLTTINAIVLLNLKRKHFGERTRSTDQGLEFKDKALFKWYWIFFQSQILLTKGFLFLYLQLNWS